jgi:hypothetical protein
MKRLEAEFKRRMGWTTLRGQTRKFVLEDIETLGLDGAVRSWRNEGLKMPYGIQKLIDSTIHLTSTGPLGIQGVGW